MATKRPYFPFYVNDFETDPVVEAMTAEQVGAYVLLLCKAWRETLQGSIPSDDKTLARWARVTQKRWAAIKSGVLKAFQKPSGGRMVQKRMTEEATKIAERSAVNSGNGRLGGLKRTLSERGSERLANESEFRLSETQAYAGARAGSEYGYGSGSENSETENQVSAGGGGAGGGGIEPAADLAQRWAMVCSRKDRIGMPADSPIAKRSEFAEMLRQGIPFAAIAAEIASPDRDLNEHLWQFRERLKPSRAPTKTAPVPMSEKISAARKDFIARGVISATDQD